MSIGEAKAKAGEQNNLDPKDAACDVLGVGKEADSKTFPADLGWGSKGKGAEKKPKNFTFAPSLYP